MRKAFNGKIIPCLLLVGLAGFCRAETQGSVPASGVGAADNPTVIRAGMLHYKTYCAQCHGRALQGQPLWQLKDGAEHRRAPAQDDTGHTWQHADSELLAMIRSGIYLQTAEAAEATMPGFARLMSDQEIQETIAFIKSRWALGLRLSQAMLNPGFAGLPAGLEHQSWTLPPNCGSNALQDWKTGNR